MHDQSASRISGRTRAAVSAMSVRALRITVLKSAGNFTRDECNDLSAEKIQRVKCFVFTRYGICSCRNFRTPARPAAFENFRLWSIGGRGAAGTTWSIAVQPQRAWRKLRPLDLSRPCLRSVRRAVTQGCLFWREIMPGNSAATGGTQRPPTEAASRHVMSRMAVQHLAPEASGQALRLVCPLAIRPPCRGELRKSWGPLLL